MRTPIRYRILGVVLLLFMIAVAVAQAAPLMPLQTPTPAPTAVGASEAGEAAVSPGESRSLELTVYNQNLGLVREVRRVNLVKGLNTVRFTDVASQIWPTTVHVVSLTARSLSAARIMALTRLPT